tara:strand:- start:854 stop:1042 length:189 start_codon:yes stop_codon:yes gene_type:complete
MPGRRLGMLSDVEGLTTRRPPTLMLAVTGSPVAAFFLFTQVQIDVTRWYHWLYDHRGTPPSP